MLLVCYTEEGLGAVVGIVVLIWKRSVYAFPLAVYPVVFPCIYNVTHPNLRYRHPIDPVVLLLVAIAAGSLVKTIWRRSEPAMETREKT